MATTIEHQRGKVRKFRCNEPFFKMRWSIHLVTPEDIIQRSKIQKQKKLGSHPEIEISTCDNNITSINRDDGNFVKT